MSLVGIAWATYDFNALAVDVQDDSKKSSSVGLCTFWKVRFYQSFAQELSEMERYSPVKESRSGLTALTATCALRRANL